MSTDRYYLDLTIELESVCRDVLPECIVALDDQIIFQGELSKSNTIKHHTLLLPTTHQITISYINKSTVDPDQAILIKSIDVNHIQDKKFIWAGSYRPTYPEPWATEQSQQGQQLLPILTNIDCLGWEGVWVLDFTVPVFTWIHQVKNFGTIYD